MFGLEKKPRQLFEFDLEGDLKKHPEKKKALVGTTEEKIQQIKSFLRSGTNTEDFDQYGVLLHGYSALLKVIQRITPAQ